MSSSLLLQQPDSVLNLAITRLSWTHGSMLRRKLWSARLIRHGGLILSGAVRSPTNLRNWPSPTSTSSPITHVRRFTGSTGGSGFQAFDDTIYALSTANGKAGIAVIRISGPSCIDIYKALCPDKALLKPRYAAVRSLYSPSDPSTILDSEALVLYFPTPRTVTGEDVLELHVHGGPATVKAVLSAIPLSPSSGLSRRIRYAEPGEFTKRAFFNDRLDLAQIEALSDTLAAETEQQRRAAVRGNLGRLGQTYEAWRTQLLHARAEIEALIDFSEDQHFDESPADLLSSVKAQIEDMLGSIRLHEQGSQRSELLRNGIRIALLGPPNVGKSSLMNLVVGREASIVSGEAGTTRDIVEASLDIRGYLCSFADTAGFRSSVTTTEGHLNGGTVGVVEEEGIRRARRKAEESDVVVVLASIEEGPKGPFVYYDAETLDLAAQAQSCLLVVNKVDTVSDAQCDELLGSFGKAIRQGHPGLSQTRMARVSCHQAQVPSAGVMASRNGRNSANPDPGNVHSLIDALVESFSYMTEMPADLQDLLGVTERQRQLLVKCRTHLEDFAAEATSMAAAAEEEEEEEEGRKGTRGIAREPDCVLAAEHLRYAATCLARITGRGEGGDVEDVLGVVFEKFCVGK